MATLLVAIVASVALIRKIVNLVVVALRHLKAEFAFHAKLDLFSRFFVSEPLATCNRGSSPEMVRPIFCSGGNIFFFNT